MLLNLYNYTTSPIPLFMLVFVPFAIFIFCYFFSWTIPAKISLLVATAPVGLLATLPILFLYINKLPTIVIYDLWPFSESILWIRWSFVFDQVSTPMCLIVLWVTFAVLLFANYYMSSDPFVFKFINFLILFSGCMVVFVTAENLVIMFCGWEALGICSFALIGFWNTRLQAVKSALKAITVNRIGDVAFLCAIGLVWFEFKTFSFTDLGLLSFNHTPSYLNVFNFLVPITDLMAFLFLIAASAKSAQLGFHIWLSDAMEGPTPVSALLHAATMVTAGVYLLIRVSPIMVSSPLAQISCILVGSITALTAAVFAFFQFDVKKMIAFSTSSQIGFMFVACGAGFPNIALYHLMTHAFFKALLFVCAGCIIHCFGGEQDVRRMGGLFFTQPALFGAMLLGSAALAGIPFLAGFYSKDLIFGTLATSPLLFNNVIFGVLLVAALLTSVYSANLLVLVFFGFRRSTIRQILVPSESHRLNAYAWGAILLLTIPSVLAGWCIRQFYPWLWVSCPESVVTDSVWMGLELVEGLSVIYKILVLLPPLMFLFSLFVQRGSIWYRCYSNYSAFKHLYMFFQNRAFFENIYYYFLVRPVLNYIYFILLVEVERFTLELLVVNMPIRIVSMISRYLNVYHSGSVVSYLAGFSVAFFLTIDTCLYFV